MINALFFVTLAVYAYYTGLKLKKDLHMVQLNSYMPSRYGGWLKENYRKQIHIKELLPILAVIPLLVGNVFFSHLVFLAGYLLVLVSRQERPEKKKLVFTARAKRLYFTALKMLVVLLILSFILVWFSPTPLIIGLVYLGLVLLSIFSFATMYMANVLIWPIEQRINHWYYRDAQRIIKSMPGLTVIGITGSFGKTSVKHIVSRILAEKYNVLMTPESYNTPMGITKAVRTMLKPFHEVFVAEMGAKQKGNIKELCELAFPKYGILTAVGEQHLDTFKTLETIKNTKFELIDSLPPDGTAFFNMDDQNVRELSPRAKVKAIKYGTVGDDLHYKAFDIAITGKGTTFSVNTHYGETATFLTKLLGKHNINNILAGISVAREMGLDLPTIVRGVKAVEPVPHRLELKRTPQNVTVIDDAFNSNPVGSAMALEVLGQIEGNKKILVTPGMIELGEKEYELNKAFGEKAGKVCDYVILVGPKRTAPIQAGLKNVAFPAEKIYLARNLDDANQHLQSVINAGDVVLFENDLPDTYNE